jgi:PAS domain S-box-containing protein
MLAVLPAILILLYTGMEQRRQAVEKAEQEMLQLTSSMADVQEDISSSVKQVLSTLSLLPEIQSFNIPLSGKIIRDVLHQNLDYLNIALTDLNGDVLVSGKTVGGGNLADRKHFQEALKSKDFAVGEFIISRVGTKFPAFAYAYPVLDENREPIAVLTTIIKLERFSRFHKLAPLPVNSFIAVTDHKGIRLFYHPPKIKSNPIGKPINPKSWEQASRADKPGIFMGKGSDGISRMFAFEPVRLSPEGNPYLFVWAGIPEDFIFAPANSTMTRNLMLMLLATLLALAIAWMVGRKTLLAPIRNLVSVTQEFAEGNLEAGRDYPHTSDEFDALMKAFHDMADALNLSHKSLRENEARFRLVMDSLDALVYVADMDTYEILFINKSGRELFGDITGSICWQSLQSGKNGPCSFCSNKYLLDENGNIRDVYIWEFQNTVTERWYHLQDRAITWIDGRIVRLEIATDITERKLTEIKLAEESGRLQVTLRSIGDGVIATDTRGHVVLINSVAETLTGWTSEQAEGRHLTEVFNIVNAETRQPVASQLEKALSSEEVIALESNAVLISKDGRDRNIDDSGAPIKDYDGNIIGVVFVFRDITEQLRTEQELVKIRKLESVGVLAGGIAHDFNNILAAILGNIDLSLLQPDVPGRSRKLLQEAIKASYRARDLTQQLLTFAKGGEPIKETASLIEIIKDSAEFVLRGDKASCHYTFPEDLWFVEIDRGQISQVVQNIILNASNAMPTGGKIEVYCENVDIASISRPAVLKDDRYVKMTIRDYGVGIPVKVLGKIFDPYFSTKQEGSGLGLAITHSIVKNHGGHITVESTPGVGTTFEVYLPASGQGLLEIEELAETDSAMSGLRILVMDDDEQFRDVVKIMLEKMGHTVVLAQDSEETIQLYKKAMDKNPIDLTIMDLTIPGGTGGKETVQEILVINPEAKVIVSSGYSNDPVMSNYKEYGFYSAIAKPFQFIEMKRLIRQVFD